MHFSSFLDKLFSDYDGNSGITGLCILLYTKNGFTGTFRGVGKAILSVQKQSDLIFLQRTLGNAKDGIKFFKPLVFSSSSFSGILLSGILNILGIAAFTPFFSTLKIELIDLYFVKK